MHYTTQHFASSGSSRARSTQSPSSRQRRDQTPPMTSRQQVPVPRSPASMNPQFKSKVVCNLSCTFCSATVCSRGMRAHLLGDTRIELYSTDAPPTGRLVLTCRMKERFGLPELTFLRTSFVPSRVQQIEQDYRTRSCLCRIRDIACLSCGCVIGYHVTQPCERCLEGSNNGHLWMFTPDSVKGTERLDSSGTRFLVWNDVVDAEEDERMMAEFVCR